MAHLNPDPSLHLSSSNRAILPDHRHMSQYPPDQPDHLSPGVDMFSSHSSLNPAMSHSLPQHQPTYQHFDQEPTVSNVSHRLPNLDLRPIRPPYQSQSQHQLPITNSLSSSLSLPQAHHVSQMQPQQHQNAPYQPSVSIAQLTEHIPVHSPTHQNTIPSVPQPLQQAIHQTQPLHSLSRSSNALMHSLPMPVPTASIPPSMHPTLPGTSSMSPTNIDTVSQSQPRRRNTGVRKKGRSNGTTTSTRTRKPRTGPANFICPLAICGKAFRMQGDLQTHMRKHTGVEPFKCSFPDCDMRYKWRSSLSHHEGLHRKAKDFRLKPRKRRKTSNVTYPLAALANVTGIAQGHATMLAPPTLDAPLPLGIDMNLHNGPASVTGSAPHVNALPVLPLISTMDSTGMSGPLDATSMRSGTLTSSTLTPSSSVSAPQLTSLP